jgi:[CysO sulfur-carrier protein]-S-L-cysteine hydrolase
MTRAQREAIVAHAEKDAPNECCGYLSARDGVVQEVFEAENVRHSPYAFQLGLPTLEAVAELDEEGLEVGIYHSHPRSEPRPSQTDINLVSPLTEHYTYLIVSLENGGGDAADLRAWRIADGKVEEREIVYDD